MGRTAGRAPSQSANWSLHTVIAGRFKSFLEDRLSIRPSYGIQYTIPNSAGVRSRIREQSGSTEFQPHKHYEQTRCEPLMGPKVWKLIVEMDSSYEAFNRSS